MLTNKNAFTLIELLVVVLIIGILAAVAVPQYKLAVAKSSYTQAITLGTSLFNAEKVYQLANGTMTPDLDKLDINLPYYDSQTKKAYDSNNKKVACYKGGDPEIYCRLELFGATVFWWSIAESSLCLFDSAQQEFSFAEKVCKSFCNTEPRIEWSTMKTCIIK